MNRIPITLLAIMLALLTTCEPFEQDSQFDPNNIYFHQQNPPGAKYVFLNAHRRFGYDGSWRLKTLDFFDDLGNFYSTEMVCDALAVSGDFRVMAVIFRYHLADFFEFVNSSPKIVRIYNRSMTLHGSFPIDQVTDLCLNQDGSVLYYICDNKIYYLHVAQGLASAQLLYDPGGITISRPRISPDSSKMLFVHEQPVDLFYPPKHRIMLYDIPGHSLSTVFLIPETGIGDIAWQPDSSGFLYSTWVFRVIQELSNPTEGNVYRYTFSPPAIVQLTHPTSLAYGSCMHPSILPDGRILLVSDKRKRASMTIETILKLDTIHELAVMDADGKNLSIRMRSEINYPFWDVESVGDIYFPAFMQ